jgi:hypothetical protein
MALPSSFLFNQSNLQDYVECQRRFQLRYLFRLAWPAIEVEPFLEFEHLLEQGMQFHKIVRQHLAGIPESQIEQSLGDNEEMLFYWSNYMHSLKDGILRQIFQDADKHFEELIISIPMNEFRLIAKYDVLIIHPDGKLTILDWKTSHNLPKRKWLADRLQTHIYPFVLAHRIAGLTIGDRVDPDQVEMIYWFTNQPEQPVHYDYNEQESQADGQLLGNLISTISQKTEPEFRLTPDVKRCLFCTYRSLCDRGVGPGNLHHLEQWQDMEPSTENVTLDYEQIGEIEF